MRVRLADKIIETGQPVSVTFTGNMVTMHNLMNGMTVTAPLQEFLDSEWLVEVTD